MDHFTLALSDAELNGGKCLFTTHKLDARAVFDAVVEVLGLPPQRVAATAAATLSLQHLSWRNVCNARPCVKVYSKLLMSMHKV